VSLVHTDPQVRPEAVKRLSTCDLRYRSQPWYEAYMTALFESNDHQAVEKLKLAEKLMIDREREIYNQAAALAERSALDKALEALRALRLCLNLQK